MTEIKVKAWDGKKFYESWSLNWMVKGSDAPRDWLNSEGAMRLWPEGTVFVRYTGMKDANSDEIYDGDVVEYLDGEYSFSAVVEWGDFGWYLRGIVPEDNFNFEDTPPHTLGIIGNIYENPELLEQGIIKKS